jgi:metallophosphoesterase (TIGR03767 family)
MDHQSPGRVELLDRFADPDSPLRDEVGIIGTYRAQELFTFQVAEAMIRAVRGLAAGPVSGAPLAFTVVTGDATDNCQLNELRSYLACSRPDVVPDSGDLTRYEGVAGPEVEDDRYWHPDGGGDIPTGTYGFPSAPGVLDALRRPFRSAGLGMPWYTVHGNHDNMLQGTVRPEKWMADFLVRGQSTSPAASAWTARIPSGGSTRRTPPPWPTWRQHQAGGHPGPRPRPVTRSGHVREHFRSPGQPAGHGYTQRNADEGTAYYAFDHGPVRCISLDTVNPHGGWQGSLDATQLGWLEGELTACADRPVVLFSHHPLETLINGTRPPGADRRILAGELRDVLLGHPCVIAWVNGHTHEHKITAIRADGSPGGFWQITTASHIDWPQQSRVIELLATDGGLAICCTVLDTALRPRTPSRGGPADLAALARELAANDWQVKEGLRIAGARRKHGIRSATRCCSWNGRGGVARQRGSRNRRLERVDELRDPRDQVRDVGLLAERRQDPLLAGRPVEVALAAVPRPGVDECLRAGHVLDAGLVGGHAVDGEAAHADRLGEREGRAVVG